MDIVVVPDFFKISLTSVFSPQKGAMPQQVARYDGELARSGNFIETPTDCAMMDTPGAGSAGGFGFALLALGWNMVSGAKLVAETMDMGALLHRRIWCLPAKGRVMSNDYTVKRKDM